MPGFDRTGPAGQGSTTGRRMGFCFDSKQPLAPDTFGAGRGYNRRFHTGFRGDSDVGLGFAHRWRGTRFQIHQNSSQEVTFENEIRSLKEQLSTLEKRINKAENT